MPTQYWPAQWYYPTITSTTTNASNSLYGISYTMSNSDWYPATGQAVTRWVQTSSNSISNDVVWEYWVNATSNTTGIIYTHTPQAVVRDAAQVAADHRAGEERREQRQLASVRARALLEDFLSDEQKAELAQGFFHVVGSRGRRYRIRAAGQAGNVELLRPDGALQARLCAHPRNGLPDADAWLAQALELRSDEDNFLKIANVHAGCLPDDLYAVAA